VKAAGVAETTELGNWEAEIDQSGRQDFLAGDADMMVAPLQTADEIALNAA
jgi:hypothetical protein